MVELKKFVRKMLIRFRIFPSVYLYSSPFKIYEFKQLIKGEKFSKEDVVLDLGCGTGLQTLHIGKKCKQIIGVDPNESAIGHARKLSSECRSLNILNEFRCGKLEEENFCDNYFDKVFSICTIEHIPNYEETIKEIYRILKPGGKFLLSVDCLETIQDQKLLQKHKKDNYVIKLFKADELRNILETSGFKNVKVYPIFRSEFSRKLFIKGIKNCFRYGKKFFLYYLVLIGKEALSKNDKGIFLIAKGEKLA